MLNISKTSFVLFSPVTKPLENVTILINKQAISQKNYVKYLGVLIDSRLILQQHISAIKKIISRIICLIYKLRNFLIYAIPVWGIANNSNINPIKVIQKKIVRLKTFTDAFPQPHGPLTHTTPIFCQLAFRLQLRRSFSAKSAASSTTCQNHYGLSSIKQTGARML